MSRSDFASTRPRRKTTIIDRSPQQRLALPGFLLGNGDSASDPDAEVVWNLEIRDRIRAVDEGRVIGIPYADVMREQSQDWLRDDPLRQGG